MKSLHTLLAFALPLLFMAAGGNAQESIAHGPVKLQETWNALNSQVSDATFKANSLDIRINQIVVCNKAKKLYSPGKDARGNPSDAQGCVDNFKINDLETSITKMNSDIDSINAKITDYNNRLSIASKKVTAIQGNVTTLSSQIAGLTSLSADLATKANNALTQIASLSARLDTIKSQITVLYGTYDTHTAQIADLYNRINGLNSSITSVNSSIANANNTLSSLNGTAAGLNGYIQAILYCGANNMLYNRNSGGCVNPAGAGSCHMYLASTTTGNCGAGQFKAGKCVAYDDGNHGNPGGGGANGGAKCTSTQYSCWAMSCS